MKNRLRVFVSCAEYALMSASKTSRFGLRRSRSEPRVQCTMRVGYVLARGRRHADHCASFLSLPASQALAAAQARENMAKCCRFVSWVNKFKSDGGVTQLCAPARLLFRSADLVGAAPRQQWIRSDRMIPVRRYRRGDSGCTGVARQLLRAGRTHCSLLPSHPPYPACSSRARPGVYIPIDS